MTAQVEKFFFVRNSEGYDLVEYECKGMGSQYTFCDELADCFTFERASNLAAIYGGTVVPAPF